MFEKLYGKEREIIVSLFDYSDENSPNFLREKYGDFYAIKDELDALKSKGYLKFVFNILGELDDFKILTKGRSYKEMEADFQNDLQQNQPKPEPKSQNASSDIFIVHGHDDLMKVSVSNFIRKIGFNPIILHEQPDGGRTIIEKFQDYSDVAFAIILYSPDDEMKTGKKRARQNVILEHGFYIGKLGRNKVVGLVKEPSNLELPSDLQGILYKPFDDNWELSIAKEMKHSGLEIDLNKI